MERVIKKIKRKRKKEAAPFVGSGGVRSLGDLHAHSPREFDDFAASDCDAAGDAGSGDETGDDAQHRGYQRP